MVATSPRSPDRGRSVLIRLPESAHPILLRHRRRGPAFAGKTTVATEKPCSRAVSVPNSAGHHPSWTASCRLYRAGSSEGGARLRAAIRCPGLLADRRPRTWTDAIAEVRRARVRSKNEMTMASSAPPPLPARLSDQVLLMEDGSVTRRWSGESSTRRAGGAQVAWLAHAR